MEPARTIIALLGGDTRLAKLLEVDRTTVARWKLHKSQGGTSGVIPDKYRPLIIHFAKERGVASSLPPFERERAEAAA